MNNIRIYLATLVTALVAGCATSPIEHLEGEAAITQLNMWHYRNQHETTNYQVDNLIPVNSRVDILDTSGDEIEFRVVETGEVVTLANVERYTGEGIAEIYERYFGDSLVDLNQFTDAEREAIEEGDVELGMSKDAVLIARGYPPAHETPSLDNNRWRYWRTRFDTENVHFSGGEVESIED